MPDSMQADICVIGAGSAGLSVAAGAAQMGATTVLIEADRMGGECLYTGCVPSKSLLAAAAAAHAARTATQFGLAIPRVEVDFPGVHRHVRTVIAAIEPNDSQARFEKLGCRVIRAPARFRDSRTVEAGGVVVRARRFVVATGSRAAVPAIPGLEGTPYLTNETVFDLTELPRHLVVIGAGPVGCELAQAFRRLGSLVTIIDRARLLPKDDADAAALIRDALVGEGVRLIEDATVEAVHGSEAGVEIVLRGSSPVAGSHLLIATGRQANVTALGLEHAGVDHDASGIKVDRRLRTSNRRVFAVGDVAGGMQFTHLAGYHAGIVLRNALLRWPTRVDLHAFPYVTYTAPELAQVGLGEAQARERHGAGVRVLRTEFADNDRAQAERKTHGFLKIVARSNGVLLGATIVGPQAGELIQLWTLVLSQQLKLSAVAGMIAPYPTLGEIGKQAASRFYAPLVFGPWTRRLVRWLGALR
jgi:pyruvate/2-oxoglutarate dehydrogenase complex dihydrolipoamide dehydrogenase (E3) component